MLGQMDEESVLERIEELVAEEHRLWRAESDGGLDDAGHERLAEVRRRLDQAYVTLRRRRAGQPDGGARGPRRTVATERTRRTGPRAAALQPRRPLGKDGGAERDSPGPPILLAGSAVLGQ